MRLDHRSSLIQPQAGVPSWSAKIVDACYSSDNQRLAVVTADRAVIMYNEKGERVDKFATKPNNSGPKTYMVRGMQFSPDPLDAKLAIAQSDNVVFVYKWTRQNMEMKEDIGTSKTFLNKWSGKKSICNKFQETSSPTCLAWPCKNPQEVIYGLAEGEIKSGHLRSNKSHALYKASAAAIAISSNSTGTGLVSSHADGSIYRYIFGAKGSTKASLNIIYSCTYPVHSLSWGDSVCLGENEKVTFIDSNGKVEQVFDYSSLDDNCPPCKEFTASSFNSSGNVVAVGNYNHFRTFSKENGGSWIERPVTTVKYMCSVTTLSWKRDGSSLVLGTSCGLLDIYDSFLRRSLYKSGFELTFVSQCQVWIRRPEDDSKQTLLKSGNGQDITDIKIHRDPGTNIERYVVAHTRDSILCADIDSSDNKVSEIQWKCRSGNERYIFDAPSAYVISNVGEVTLVEHGSNEILTSIRTEFTSSSLLSIRMNEHAKMNARQVIAYLIDKQTICIKDIISQVTAIVNHDNRVDFIELNTRGQLLLFRDRTFSLHIFDVTSQSKTHLLSDCGYVQWVPDSDVVVAQRNSTMCVWYNLSIPSEVVTREICGEIEGIERTSGRTEVIVETDSSQSFYLLVEELIEFSLAIDDDNHLKALVILRQMELTPQTEAMWLQLQDACIEVCNFHIAEQCAAALRDLSRAAYYRRLAKISYHSEAGDLLNGQQSLDLRGKLFEMRKKVDLAEELYLSHNRAGEAIRMYDDLSMHKQAIAITERYQGDDAVDRKRKYFEALVSSNQNAAAAELKVDSREYVEGIGLFMKARMPGRAAAVVLKHGIVQPLSLMEKIASALKGNELFEHAGKFYFERLNKPTLAIDAYIQGSLYRNAVDLARKYEASKVVQLEKQWGDYLFTTENKADEAIEHYMEAHAYTHAFEAALKCKRLSLALSLIKDLDYSEARPAYRKLGHHFFHAGKFDEAENCFIEGSQPIDAIDMYIETGFWDKANILAQKYLSDDKLDVVSRRLANNLEGLGYLKRAEQILLSNHKTDEVISMYSKNRMFDTIARKIAKSDIAFANETNEGIATLFEEEGDNRAASKYYCLCGDWSRAVDLCKANEMWGDAIQLARTHGDQSGIKQIAYSCFVSRNEAGLDLVKQLGVADEALDFAVEKGCFDHAFRIAKSCDQQKICYVHFKYALQLEKEHEYSKAEVEFLKASKPREAIDMYLHQKDFGAASRIAADNIPEASILAEAELACESRDFAKAEAMFLLANKPQFVLDLYEKEELWDEAKRIVNAYLPDQKGGYSYQDHSRDEEMDVSAAFDTDSSIKDDVIDHSGTDMGVNDHAPVRKDAVKTDLSIIEQDIIEKRYDRAISALVTLGAPYGQQYMDLYRSIVLGVLGRNSTYDENVEVQARSVSALKELLQLSWLNAHGTPAPSFERMFLAVHYVHMFYLSLQHSIGDISAKCSISLLQFLDYIPPDKAFHIAGREAKRQEHINLAFLLFNRYVDVFEAIEENDLSSANIDDTLDGTVVPDIVTLPKQHYLANDDAREEIKDWVLSKCMDSHIQQKLPPVERARGTIYAGLYDSRFPRCFITGYPIESSKNSMDIKGSFKANKHDWKMLVDKTKVCPWTGQEIQVV